MCLYPTLIRNPKYTRNTKNGGNPPPLKDPRAIYTPIGCGNCIECSNKKKRDWQLRLQEDIKTNKNAKFVTLTISNSEYTNLIQNKEGLKALETIQKATGYDRDNHLATIITRLWLERYRKAYKKSLRHFLVTELGHQGTENIHLHGIIWTDHTQDTIAKIWKYGYIWPKNQKDWQKNYVNAKTINYIIKYITKKDEQHKTYQSIILTSAGIGNKYVQTCNATKNKFKEQTIRETTDTTYITTTGHRVSLPIYWRNKIYTDEQREQLWMQQLDKKTRYVLKNKIDISKGITQYQKVLATAQKQNKKLGYGNGKINWQQRRYEEQLRDLNNKKRQNNT